MAKVLLRARKGPFDAIPAGRSLRQDAFGSNAGNLVFSHAAYKILSTSGSTVEHGQMPARPDDADRINQSYDVFVVPLANAFRRSFLDSLRGLTKLIERLTIPVVVLGVGAQSNLDYDLARLQPLDDAVRAFVAAVLKRSASIGVRGELTANYLRHLGFGDDEVDVIGCPSVFLHGRGFQVTNPDGQLGRQDRIALTVSPYVRKMGEIVMRHHQNYPNLLYIPQNTVDLRMMLRGDQPEDRGQTSKIPIYTTHPLYVEGKMRFFLDPWTWIEHLSGYRFTFGSRIHGSIVSVLADTPAYVLAHDSRTLELARYFELPYRTIDKVRRTMDAAELYELADYSGFNAGYEARLDTLVRFLDKNGLDHIFRPGESGRDFDERVARTEFPPPVRPRAKPARPHLAGDRPVGDQSAGRDHMDTDRRGADRRGADRRGAGTSGAGARGTGKARVPALVRTRLRRLRRLIRRFVRRR